MHPNFIHLDIHTEYSLSDGLCRIDELLETTAKHQMPAIAISDKSNLFAAIKFYQQAIDCGIKPLLSAEILVVYGEQSTRLLLICKNAIGYRNLSALLSKAYQQQTAQQLVVQREWLLHGAEGLIAISGGYDSDIGHALLNEQTAKAATLAAEWATLFPHHFYLHISRIGREQEEIYIRRVVQLAQEQQLPVIASNEVRFIAAEDFMAHEARVAINAGYTLEDPKRPKNYTPQQYLRTPQEMQTLFADCPDALRNTVELAKRCNMQFALGEYHLPNFPLPEQATVEDYLAEQAAMGLQQRYILLSTPDEKKIIYAERLQTELEVINAMGFASYFLIVADFIQWAKQQDIPVGPGRGSGAGSLVAYVLGITDLDPLQYDLLFERFLNPERVSLPDFDIDFCMDRRDEVIEYVAERYGRDKVAQIITFGTMAAKAVVRDVGRVLAFPYGFVDKLAKLIPFEIGMTLEKALIDSDILRTRYEEEEDVKELINLALKLEGIARNAGKHAGGVVIAPQALTHFVPLYCEAETENVHQSIVTQFDKDDIETIGLVKFDFLGLRTLTIIHWACKNINRVSQADPISIERIPLNDKATFKLLQECKTTAVFQLESRGMKELIKRLQPDCFEDIIALVALFRPGPLQSGMVDDFINRKHGRATATYFHPLLEPILRPTYGVILYQEQVMQIAQVLSGYTLGSADLLRRAMGKKKPEEMAKQREIFVQGAIKNSIDPQLAKTVFDLIEKFAGYGFNKSHSAAYALLAYQTAWLKTHYPAAFMAAVCSADMDNTDKVVNFIEDCRAIKVVVIPPDINRSEYPFTVEGNDIIYGLGAIKGAGEAAIESIVTARKLHGKFTGLFDLCQKIDARKVNRRVLEGLIRAGALDGFAVERATLLASLEDALKMAEQKNKNQLAGQVDLFQNAADTEVKEHYIPAPAWSLMERLTGEKNTLGFYCTGHPLDAISQELKQLQPVSLIKLRAEPGRNQWIAGLIFNLRVVKTKQGKQLLIITLDDKTTRLDVVLFSNDFELYRDLLVKDHILFVEGEVSVDQFSGGLKVRAKRLMNLAQARAQCTKKISIHMNNFHSNFTQHLSACLQPFVPGKCPVEIQYQTGDINATLRLGPAWQVNGTDELVQELILKLGEKSVKVDYQSLN